MLPTRGTFDECANHIAAVGLPEQWRQILENYASLLDDSAQGPEALRRALFLAWYSINEPWEFTGLLDMPQDVERRVLYRVDKLLATGRIDPELRSMLRGYGPGRPFDRYPELEALAGFMANISGSHSPDAPLGSMQDRGALGVYWQSRNDVPRS